MMDSQYENYMKKVENQNKVYRIQTDNNNVDIQKEYQNEKEDSKFLAYSSVFDNNISSIQPSIQI